MRLALVIFLLILPNAYLTFNMRNGECARVPVTKLHYMTEFWPRGISKELRLTISCLFLFFLTKLFVHYCDTKLFESTRYHKWPSVGREYPLTVTSCVRVSWRLMGERDDATRPSPSYFIKKKHTVLSFLRENNTVTVVYISFMNKPLPL